MAFLRNLLGKKQTAATPGDGGIATVTLNPFTTDAAFGEGTLLFRCPNCLSAVSVALQEIDPIVGANVVCRSCKDISHVPGAYKAGPQPPSMRITASVRVPMARFADWYYEHPYIKSLIQSGQSDLLFDYGLWAFCGACYHPFPATVLNYLPVASGVGSSALVFNARTPESARDMDALLAGHCPRCLHQNLVVIVCEIPDYIRSLIKSKRG